jgi:demethylmenaquinone methyltransferase/2-methoxy-6-polyprenyl-1,4-benzoquinol methylase
MWMDIPTGFVDKARFVRVIFTDVEREYDALLHLMTFSFDSVWRRRLLSKINFSRDVTILDLACGTGLVTYALSRRANPNTLVVGLDLSAPMLRVAKTKRSTAHSNCRIEFMRAVGEFLPFRQNLFTYVTVGLALRNFANRIAMFKESLRVLKCGGWFLSIDFVRLRNAHLWPIYEFHIYRVLPSLGRLVSEYWRRTLIYLASSIRIAVGPEENCKLLNQVGFQNIGIERITLGVVALLSGRK